MQEGAGEGTGRRIVTAVLRARSVSLLRDLMHFITCVDGTADFDLWHWRSEGRRATAANQLVSPRAPCACILLPNDIAVHA